MDRSEQEDEQRLREALCERRSVRICCHDSPHAEAVDSPLRPFHTVSLSTRVNKGTREAALSTTASGGTMTGDNSITLELDDIQAGVLRGRPTPYAGAFLLLRIDDPRDGRTLAGRLADVVHEVHHPATDTSFSVGFTYAGLRALGVPQESLETFAPEFRQGMAARAELLGDVGPNAPENWEAPLGSDDVHVAVIMLAPDVPRFEATLETARTALNELPCITRLWRQDVWSPEDGRNSFDFRDGISHPAVEGSGIPPRTPRRSRSKLESSYWATPTRRAASLPSPSPTPWGAMGATWSSASSTRMSPLSAATSEALRKARRTPGGSPPRSWDAGPAAPRSRSRRTKM